MSNSSTVKNKSTVHHGHNCRRIREASNISLEDLAKKIKISVPQLSEYEEKEILEDPVIESLADALGVKPETIKNLTEDTVNNYMIQHNYDGSNSGAGNVSVQTVTSTFSFNPIEKIVELYERIIKEKDSTIEILKDKTE